MQSLHHRLSNQTRVKLCIASAATTRFPVQASGSYPCSDFGFRVYGLGIKPESMGRVHGQVPLVCQVTWNGPLFISVQGLGFRVSGLGFRVQGAGCRV